jgi:hypothetical protein
MFWQARPGLIAPNVAALSPVSGGDPYWANVVFLAGWEGSDGGTSYNEEKNNRAATFVGNAQLDTAQFEVGTASLLLDGTGDYVTFADNDDWAMGPEFTIELSVRYNSVTDAEWISQYDNIASVAGWKFGQAASEIVFLFYDDGSALRFVTASWTPSTGTWYKVAVDRDASGDVRLYVDGTYMGKDALGQAAFRNTTKALSIGRRDHSTPRYVNGWIDEVRITNGVARYASDAGYTPTAFQRF